MPKSVFVRLECSYCGDRLEVPANVPEPDLRAANWVQVVYRDEAEVFCSPAHASQWLKNKTAIILVPKISLPNAVEEVVAG